MKNGRIVYFVIEISTGLRKRKRERERNYSVVEGVTDVDGGVVLLLPTVSVSLASLTSPMLVIDLESTLQLQRFRSKVQSSALTDASGGSTATNRMLTPFSLRDVQRRFKMVQLLPKSLAIITIIWDCKRRCKDYQCNCRRGESHRRWRSLRGCRRRGCRRTKRSHRERPSTKPDGHFIDHKVKKKKDNWMRFIHSNN